MFKLQVSILASCSILFSVKREILYFRIECAAGAPSLRGRAAFACLGKKRRVLFCSGVVGTITKVDVTHNFLLCTKSSCERYWVTKTCPVLWSEFFPTRSLRSVYCTVLMTRVIYFSRDGIFFCVSPREKISDLKFGPATG